MRRTAVFTVALVALAACRSDGNTLADAPPLADANPNLHDIGLHYVGDQPAVLVFRDGSGAYQPIDVSRGTGLFSVTNDYVLVAVCANDAGDAARAVMIAATFADGGEQSVVCFAPGDGPGAGSGGATHVVSGAMVQAGSVSMNAIATSATAPWSYQFDAGNGLFDIAAFDPAAATMALRRDVSVNGSDVAVTPDLDLTMEGSATVTADLAITGGAAGGTTTIDDQLITSSGTTAFPTATGTTAHLAPASLLVDDDQQRLEIAVRLGAGAQTAVTRIDGTAAAPLAYALLPALDGVTFAAATGTEGASWTTLPDAAASDVHLVLANTAGTVQHDATATGAWLAATSASTLALDTVVPGFDAAWKLDATATGTFAFESTSGSVAFATSVSKL